MEEVIEMVKKPNTFKLIIPNDVQNKIQYICMNIPDTEWSGILFYTYTGNFKDKSLILTCKDIYLMDVGNAVYTEFEMSPEVISYMSNNIELVDCQIGLIHSHGHIETFFSGTDINTLKVEGKDRNHFLSLIVNNKGTYTAAITRKYKINNICYCTFNNEEVREETHDNTEFIEYFDLKIEVENTFDNNIINRINEINERKRKDETIKASHKYSNQIYTLSPQINYKDWYSDTTNEYEFTDNLEFESIVRYDSIKIRERVINHLVLQLLTGSVIVPMDSKIDINKWSWLSKMESLFDDRFGKDDSDLVSFNEWAEGFVDYLCYNTENASEEEVDSDYKASAIAYWIVKKLNKLNKNKYIESYIDILNKYIYD